MIRNGTGVGGQEHAVGSSYFGQGQATCMILEVARVLVSIRDQLSTETAPAATPDKDTDGQSPGEVSIIHGVPVLPGSQWNKAMQGLAKTSPM
jgi:hypothetical protein